MVELQETVAVPEFVTLRGLIAPQVRLAGTVSVRLTVPVKPLRPVTLVGRIVDAGRPSTAVLPVVTAKLAGAVPGHVTRLVTCWLTAASPAAVRHGANSIWLVRLSYPVLHKYM